MKADNERLERMNLRMEWCCWHTKDLLRRSWQNQALTTINALNVGFYKQIFIVHNGEANLSVAVTTTTNIETRMNL